MSNRDTHIDKIIGQLTLEQKVGQLFTQAFYGSFLTPDTVRTIKTLNCGGLRITSHFRQFRRYARPGEEAAAFEKLSPADLTPNLLDDRKDTLCPSPHLTITEYAELMDEVKRVAADRPYDIPLLMMLDQEGDTSFDCLRGGMRTFPSQFGYARTHDAALVRDIAESVARQLSAVGFNTINSPCVDVVFNPDATYIRTRAFGCDVEHVSAMAVAAIEGYKAGGLIPCAKHFPGVGSTAVDAHHDVRTIEKSLDALWNDDLEPYRRMIEAGLDAIMVGHAIYPSVDPEHLSSVSDEIINGILRERLQFKGIVATDSMIMGAIAKKYGVPQGCLRALKAGASAILMKEAGPIREESLRVVMEAVRTGDITEAHIDGLLIRNLRVKFDRGLFGDAYRPVPAKAEAVARSDEMEKIETRAAETAVHLIRDDAGLLPLAKDKRTLLVEQVTAMQVRTNDYWVHPGIFWDQVIRHSENVSLLEIEANPSDEDMEKLKLYLPFYDCVILTYYKDRHTKGTAHLVEAARVAGKEVIVVTNNPFPYELPADWPTVIASYGTMAPVLKVAADLIFGAFTPVKKDNPAPWEAQ